MDMDDVDDEGVDPLMSGSTPHLFFKVYLYCRVINVTFIVQGKVVEFVVEIMGRVGRRLAALSLDRRGWVALPQL